MSREEKETSSFTRDSKDPRETGEVDFNLFLLLRPSACYLTRRRLKTDERQRGEREEKIDRARSLREDLRKRTRKRHRWVLLASICCQRYSSSVCTPPPNMRANKHLPFWMLHAVKICRSEVNHIAQFRLRSCSVLRLLKISFFSEKNLATYVLSGSLPLAEYPPRLSGLPLSFLSLLFSVVYLRVFLSLVS